MQAPGFTIELFDSDGIGVIIARPTGVIYTNQAGGYACLQPELEGVFVPLPQKACEKLEAHFTGPKWGGRCDDGIDAETADVVDEVLSEDGFVSTTVRVDREKFAESYEAWIWVKVSTNGYLWPGLMEATGVLTWGNSD